MNGTLPECWMKSNCLVDYGALSDEQIAVLRLHLIVTNKVWDTTPSCLKRGGDVEASFPAEWLESDLPAWEMDSMLSVEWVSSLGVDDRDRLKMNLLVAGYDVMFEQDRRDRSDKRG